jgi:hypothetical protein
MDTLGPHVFFDEVGIWDFEDQKPKKAAVSLLMADWPMDHGIL